MSATHNVARPRRRAPRVSIVAQFPPHRGRASRERRAFVRERAGVVLEDSSKGSESDAEAELSGDRPSSPVAVGQGPTEPRISGTEFNTPTVRPPEVQGADRVEEDDSSGLGEAEDSSDEQILLLDPNSFSVLADLPDSQEQTDSEDEDSSHQGQQQEPLGRGNHGDDDSDDDTLAGLTMAHLDIVYSEASGMEQFLQDAMMAYNKSVSSKDTGRGQHAHELALRNALLAECPVFLQKSLQSWQGAAPPAHADGVEDFLGQVPATDVVACRRTASATSSSMAGESGQ